MDLSVILVGLEPQSATHASVCLNALSYKVEVTETNSVSEAAELITEYPPHLAFVNIDHQGDCGPSVFDLLSANTCENTGFVLFSVYGSRLLVPLKDLYDQLGFRIIDTVKIPFGMDQMLSVAQRIKRNQQRSDAIALPDGDLSESLEIRLLPRFNAKNCITGCDVLSRLNVGSETLPVDSFIQHIQSLDPIIRITRAVIQKTIETLVVNRSVFEELELSLIFPKSLLSDPDFVQEMVYLCESNSIRMEKLYLILREDSILLTDEAIRHRALNIILLVRMGFKFAVDRQPVAIPYDKHDAHPIDQFKLAPGVAQGLRSSPFSQALLAASCSLTSEYEVVVCGVESKEVYKEINRRCGSANRKALSTQGYFHSQPLDVSELTSLVTTGQVTLN